MFVLVVIVVLLGSVGFFVVTSRGISAKAEPGRMETIVARTMRSLAIPRGDRDLKDPVAVTPATLAAGMAHWADHCAVCHANDGSGQTQIGRSLYPKAPDMRRPPTQSLTDGQLFYIIENGVRLTGMPAWGNGTPESAEGTWHLVQFIRTLPTLTPADIAEMESMNPRSPGKPNGDDAIQRFLNGEEPAAVAPSPAHKHGGR